LKTWPDSCKGDAVTLSQSFGENHVMKNIILLTLGVLLLAGSASAEIRVYDANGQFLGATGEKEP